MGNAPHDGTVTTKKQDLGDFSCKDFAPLNQDGKATGSDGKEQNAAIQEFGGLKAGSKTSSITKTEKVSPPAETPDSRHWGGVVKTRTGGGNDD